MKPWLRRSTMDSSMARAILGGNKTQHRYVMEFQPDDDAVIEIGEIGETRGVAYIGNCRDGGHRTRVVCERGGPGDRIWVPEIWDFRSWAEEGKQNQIRITYGTDGHQCNVETPEGWNPQIFNTTRWRPSAVMPYWASRILLGVESIKVQRVQAITEEDAIAEGMYLSGELNGKYLFDWWRPCHGVRVETFTPSGAPSARDAFRNYWFQAAGQNAWHANVWTWVLKFRRIKP